LQKFIKVILINRLLENLTIKAISVAEIKKHFKKSPNVFPNVLKDSIVIKF
jgi:hypothetical protein